MYLAPTLPPESLRHFPIMHRDTALHTGKDFARFSRTKPGRFCSHLSPRPRGVRALPATLLSQRHLRESGECSDFPLSKSDCLTHVYYITTTPKVEAEGEGFARLHDTKIK